MAYLLTLVKARAEHVFLRTIWPKRAFPLTIQYGTPIFLHNAGRNRTIYRKIRKNHKLEKSLTDRNSTEKSAPTSTGSTSWAIMTNWAFFCSTNDVTVLTPLRTTNGRFVGWSGLPSLRSLARWNKRAFLSFLASGLYLSNSLNSWLAVVRNSKGKWWLVIKYENKNRFWKCFAQRSWCGSNFKVITFEYEWVDHHHKTSKITRKKVKSRKP